MLTEAHTGLLRHTEYYGCEIALLCGNALPPEGEGSPPFGGDQTSVLTISQTP